MCSTGMCLFPERCWCDVTAVSITHANRVNRVKDVKNTSTVTRQASPCTGCWGRSAGTTATPSSTRPAKSARELCPALCYCSSARHAERRITTSMRGRQTKRRQRWQGWALSWLAGVHSGCFAPQHTSPSKPGRQSSQSTARVGMSQSCHTDRIQTEYHRPYP